jgi:Zn-finger nucleic acid-binding protein
MMTSSMQAKLMTVTLVIMGTALVLAVLGAVAWLESLEVSGWAVAEGEILDSHYDRAPRKQRQYLGPDYNVWIAYRYHVQGQEYIGHRIGPSVRFLPNARSGPHNRVKFWSTASDLLMRFREGKPVQVYYDPGQPASSVIDTDMALTDSLALGCSPVIFALGLFFFLRLRRMRVEDDQRKITTPAPVRVPKPVASVALKPEEKREKGARAMDCPNCGAPMRPKPGQAYFECEHCQTIRLPEETDEGVKLMGEHLDADCPLCKKPLISGQLEGEEVYHCSECKGMLVPGVRFQHIVRALRARHRGEKLPFRPLDRRALKRQLDCPVCERPMEAHAYLGPGAVALDSCHACSLIWLDHGELTAIEKS